MTREIDISLDPANMECVDGSRYCHDGLLQAIREHAERFYCDDEIEVKCLQVGHRQGDEWWLVDGSKIDGALFREDFWFYHASNPDIFIEEEDGDV